VSVALYKARRRTRAEMSDHQREADEDATFERQVIGVCCVILLILACVRFA
jgi:hypothetical protein